VPLAVTEIHEHAFVVEGILLTDVRGSLPYTVLSTPGMIGMMELAATNLARLHIEPGTTTLGFEVCIKHVAGAREGAHCVAVATLREIVDGRKLRFDVEVREGDRIIGVGTHERRMVAGAPEPTPPLGP
jgi:fluoroacetyl-CoA thioesterase